MKNVVNFDSKREFLRFIKGKTLKEIGFGSEGSCLFGHDGLAYKERVTGFQPERQPVDEMIMADECSSGSFLFPIQLFAVNGNVVGYTSPRVKVDYLNARGCYEDDSFARELVELIDFDKLIAAYHVLMSDAMKLADEGISIFDLPYNVMFDGEKLYAVDTLGYRKVDSDVHEANRRSVDAALKLECQDVANYIDRYEFDKSMDTISFIRAFEARYKGHQDSDGFSYTKDKEY